MKYKKLFVQTTIFIFSVSLMAVSGFAIYSFGLKNVIKNENQNNTQIEEKLPVIIQPKFEKEEEHLVIKNKYFDLTKFTNLFAQKITKPITRYEIKTNNLKNIDKIKVHYWIKNKDGWWYYSLKNNL